MANRALIFEDNPINSRLMSMFLEQSGYFVELALSLDELQRKIAQGFEIVFIDTASPALNRDSLADFVHRAKISTLFACPPIVAVMNTTKDSEIKSYLNMGMDGYIIKPISVKSLRETIERVRSGQSSPAPGEDVVDVDKLSRTLGISDKAMLVSLFDKFFPSMREDLKQMSAAAAVRDYDAMRALAHNIKGAARNLRLTNLGKIAEEIESQTKYPSANLDLESLITNLDRASMRVYNDFNSRYHKGEHDK